LNIIEMNQAFIVAAYSVTWVVILGYLARLGRKSARSRGAYQRMAAREGGSPR
jgi:CcmD family protein